MNLRDRTNALFDQLEQHDLLEMIQSVHVGPDIIHIRATPGCPPHFWSHWFLDLRTITGAAELIAGESESFLPDERILLTLPGQGFPALWENVKP